MITIIFWYVGTTILATLLVINDHINNIKSSDAVLRESLVVCCTPLLGPLFVYAWYFYDTIIPNFIKLINKYKISVHKKKQIKFENKLEQINDPYIVYGEHEVEKLTNGM